jgi:Zn-dependent protease
MVPPTPPPPGNNGRKVKKAMGPLAVLAAFFSKIKLFLLPVLKFLPILLKTGGTMILSIGVYAMAWGWRFAVGFVLLLFIHECGHLIVARKMGLKVGAPMFIPFVGALIALKQMPRNAWMEALVGIGGPMLGTVGAMICYLIYTSTGNEFFAALAYTGFFLNLFNLAPLGFLDGGRIVTALSPWLWLVGAVVITAMMFYHFNFLLLIILLLSLPRLFSLFRKKTYAEARYFEVTPEQRWVMGAMYFGLIILLVLGMRASDVRVRPDHQQVACQF